MLATPPPQSKIIYKFDKFDKKSEIVSSDKSVFLYFNATQV